jgi:hypothetical protein
MLRVTVLSLLLGTAALIIVLTQFFPPEHSSQQDAPAIVWDSSKANVISGTPTRIGEELQIELDSQGAGLASLDVQSIQANDFSFIHLALEQSAKNTSVAIVWTRASGTTASGEYELENRSSQSLWLATDEFRGWEGDIGTLGLQFSGHAGDTVLIRDFSVHPSSSTHQLRAIFSDLTAYAPWNSASMNTYTGTFNVSSFYPIVLAVGLLTLSLLAYGLLLLLLRKKLKFNPSVVALIFFSTWVMLDLLWQTRLLKQLVDTQHTFSGKSTEEKLAVGPDARLYQFVSRTKPLLEPADSRVFVTSSDRYSGMRAAYYFYPLNTYWSLDETTALPPENSMRKGDYVVLVSPAPFQFDPKRQLVTVHMESKLKAELVFSDASGTVVRLK